MATDALSIQGLSHAYPTSRRDTDAVLRDVSFTVAEGELVSVLGRSGAGKTTLLRAVGGFLTPQSGDITLGGELVTSGGRILVPTERRHLGIVFQDYALFGHMTVAQNIGFGVAGRGSKKAARIDQMLELVGLTELARCRPAELSGGQQQRVALARALAPAPKLLLLDEPFANLDATLRADLRDDLRQLLRHTQTAGLLITHDRQEALSIVDRLAVLEEGQGGANLAQIASPATVYGAPATLEVARLTGVTNIVRGQATGVHAHTELGQLPLVGDHTGEVDIMARPEQLGFDAGEGPAVVVSHQFCGPTTTLFVEAGHTQVRIDVVPSEAPAIGTRGAVIGLRPLASWPRQ